MTGTHLPATALRLSRTVLPTAGFLGVVVLALATSGIPGPPVVMLAVGLTGMGALVLAWLGLGRWRAGTSVSRLYRTAAAWCLPLLFSPPLFSGDVRSYLAQGVIAARGLDPYQFGPLAALGADSPVAQQVSIYWQDATAPYGPVAVAISRTIAYLVGENLPATVLLNRIVELAGVVLIAWALPRLARRARVAPETALWLGLLNPLVLWHLVAGAHNDGLMLGLVLAGMEMALDSLGRVSRVVAGVALLAIAANIKIVAAAALCCLAAELARRWGDTRSRGILVALGVLGGGVVVSIAIAAVTGLGFGWIGTLGGSVQVHSWLAPTNQFGFLIGGLGALTGTNLTEKAIAASIGAGAVIGAVVVIGLLWSVLRGRRDALHGLGLVFAAMLVAGPVVQPWYVLWAILPLAATTRSARACWTLAAVSAVFAVLLPPASGSVSVLIQGYLGAAAVLALIVAAFSAVFACHGPVNDQRCAESGKSSQSS